MRRSATMSFLISLHVMILLRIFLPWRKLPLGVVFWNRRQLDVCTAYSFDYFHFASAWASCKMVGALLFDGAHYDVLEPVDKALPQSLLDIKNGPPEVPMRGGGSKSSLRCTEWTSSESRRTDWSQPSQAGTPAMASLRSSSSGRRSQATAICGRAKAEEPAVDVAGRRPRATATSGRAEAAGCAKGIVASSGAQPSELDVDEVVDLAAPASALSEWYQQGSKLHPAYVSSRVQRRVCLLRQGFCDKDRPTTGIEAMGTSQILPWWLEACPWAFRG